MGFMDKAKKMAEQAQQKLDEAQKGFNEKQGGGAQQSGGPAVEYDDHGRPVGSPAPVSSDTPASASPEPAKAEGDPLLSDEPGSRHGADAATERDDAPPPPPSSGPKPGMTGGDPLG